MSWKKIVCEDKQKFCLINQLYTLHLSLLTVNYTGEYDLVIWGPPGVWNGPPVVLYRSFDTLTGLEIDGMDSVASNYNPLVPGKVNWCMF